MIPTLVAALLFAQASPLPAQTPPRTVHASGEGRISVAPDIARVTIGVDAQDQSLARADADATTCMGKVMGTLEKAGVAAKDVRTIRYAVDVQRSFEKSTTGVVIGYRVVNQVLVTVRDLRRLGGLLDQVVAAGANDVDGLSLEKEDISAERGRALERAMSDARGRASVLGRRLAGRSAPGERGWTHADPADRGHERSDSVGLRGPCVSRRARDLRDGGRRFRDPLTAARDRTVEALAMPASSLCPRHGMSISSRRPW